MNCERIREIFPELLDPRTGHPDAPDGSAAELEAARTHLAHCPACQREFAALAQTVDLLDGLPTTPPSPRLRLDFYTMLAAEKQAATATPERRESTRRSASRLGWRWAIATLGGGTLIACGFLAGVRFAPKPAPQIVAVADPETKSELHELRTKIDQLESMNQVVAAAFQQQQRPANERLRGVLTSAAVPNPNDRVIDELITSLALDPSANVRLRALDALYPHADRDVVRASVLASLSREANPLVQVAMIDFLTAARDHEAKPALEKMSVSDLTNRTVREAAKRALAQL